jgi:mannose-6-phosphate isomerase-like protein (cupin superfamily)
MQRSDVSWKRVALMLAAFAALYFGVGLVLHNVVFPEPEPPAWAYPSSGASFETPTGERFTTLVSAAETNGEFIRVDHRILPGGHVAREHVHPNQEERFRVLDGSLVAVVDGEERIVSAGETVVVPPGTPHQLFNRGEVEVRLLSEVRPAGKLSLFFRQMAGVGGKPSFLQMTLFLQEYESYPAKPPPALLRPLSFLLAPTARLFGYKSFYPEYAKPSPHARPGTRSGPAQERRVPHAGAGTERRDSLSPKEESR